MAQYITLFFNNNKAHNKNNTTWRHLNQFNLSESHFNMHLFKFKIPIRIDDTCKLFIAPIILKMSTNSEFIQPINAPCSIEIFRKLYLLHKQSNDSSCDNFSILLCY